jgi:hypothetical protein
MTTINWSMLFRVLIAVYTEDEKKPIYILCKQNSEFLNVT